MKYFITIISFMLILSDVEAQTLIDSAAYDKGLKMITGAITVDDYKNAGNYFEDLSLSKPK
jgi:hypothetical protein